MNQYSTENSIKGLSFYNVDMPHTINDTPSLEDVKKCLSTECKNISLVKQLIASPLPILDNDFSELDAGIGLQSNPETQNITQNGAELLMHFHRAVQPTLGVKKVDFLH